MEGDDTIKNGETAKYVAYAIPTTGYANRQDVSNFVEWSITSEEHATINKQGVVTGMSAGKTTVAAKFADKYGRKDVTITD